MSLPACLNLSPDGFHLCCRYEGHPGDHEEWMRDGERVTPIKGQMTASWPAGPKPEGWGT